MNLMTGFGVYLLVGVLSCLFMLYILKWAENLPDEKFREAAPILNQLYTAIDKAGWGLVFAVVSLLWPAWYLSSAWVGVRKMFEPKNRIEMRNISN